MATLTQAISANSKKYDSVFECPRCSGKGWLPEFRHIKNGVCFLCAGAKVIEINKKYSKNDKIVCRVSKGYVNGYDENWKASYYYRECMGVSFDGGLNFSGHIITDENRHQMRAMWKWCKDNGAEMILEEENTKRL